MSLMSIMTVPLTIDTDCDWQTKITRPVWIAVDYLRTHISNFASLLSCRFYCCIVRFQALQFVFKFFDSSLEVFDEFRRFHGAEWCVLYLLHVINNLLPETACTDAAPRLTSFWILSTRHLGQSQVGWTESKHHARVYRPLCTNFSSCVY